MGENHVFRSTDSNRMFTPEARAKPSKFGNEWLRAAIDNFRPGENFGEPQVHLARALGNLHAVFEVDGDFKPDNVLLTRTGHIFVGDPLGNGTICTRLFRQNQRGTPGYRATEIRTLMESRSITCSRAEGLWTVRGSRSAQKSMREGRRSVRS